MVIQKLTVLFTFYEMWLFPVELVDGDSGFAPHLM